MKNKSGCLLILLLLTTLSCTPANDGQQPTPFPLPIALASSTSTSILPIDTGTSTFTIPPPTATETSTSQPTETIMPSPFPVVERLKARVTANLLSCRYGPGAEYLYLYALRGGANIELIGRTDANNWVWVDGTNKCWVNSNFLEIAGERTSLPVVYPGIAKLPITPYYPAPGWVNAIRKGNSVELTWEAVPISPGKFENENMYQYIVEVWRCENGKILFETLGTNFPFITIANDEMGCDLPSHGSVWLQEKHGFAGPLEIPWPAQ